MWRGVTAVIFDEIDQMAVDPGYALLWDSARQVAEARPLLVIGASATYSSEMIAKLNDQGVFDRRKRLYINIYMYIYK